VVKQKKAQEQLLRITQIRSGIGRPEMQRKTLQALGFRRHQQTVIQRDHPSIRGMITKVRHLVAVEEFEGGEA
jgi:large subunit ribosomal protein L30